MTGFQQGKLMKCYQPSTTPQPPPQRFLRTLSPSLLAVRALLQQASMLPKGNRSQHRLLPLMKFRKVFVINFIGTGHVNELAVNIGTLAPFPKTPRRTSGRVTALRTMGIDSNTRTTAVSAAQARTEVSKAAEEAAIEAAVVKVHNVRNPASRIKMDTVGLVRIVFSATKSTKIEITTHPPSPISTNSCRYLTSSSLFCQTTFSFLIHSSFILFHAARK